MASAPGNLTRILRNVSTGSRDDLDVLLDAMYQDLRAIAAHHMQRERLDHTLQPTAVVHEAYVRLIDQREVNWDDRAHFLALASKMIRRILVDHARAKKSDKRGGNRQRLELADDLAFVAPAGLDLIALDEALDQLHEVDPIQSRVVELRFFGGLTIEEIANVMSMGKRSVDREWSCAKAWLYRELKDEPTDGEQDELDQS